jgi:exodeoxyribonuclease V alpha subunit
MYHLQGEDVSMNRAKEGIESEPLSWRVCLTFYRRSSKYSSVAEECISGHIKRVLFTADSDSYTVFDIEDDSGKVIRVVGCAMSIAEGLRVRATGQFQNHPRFGLQFKAETVMALPPDKPEAIAKYLASGQVKGIGATLAKRLVSHFKERIREALDGDVEGLKECPGIGKHRGRTIHEAWHRHLRERETYILLAGMGLGHAQILRTIRVFGENAPARVQQNPYDLIKFVHGIGFKTADQIARRVGIKEDSPIRIQAALLFVLEQAQEAGHCFLGLEDLVSHTGFYTGAPQEACKEAILEVQRRGDIVIDKGSVCDRVFLASLYRAEQEVANRLRLLCSRNLEGILIERLPEWLSFSQKRALQAIKDAPVSVLTGGPGTGKTTILRYLVDACEERGLAVALAAPTGRAAMRLSETSGREAKTIHRLLHFNPHTMQFASEEIKADVVIVDEASMLDICLAGHLLNAIGSKTRLLLVGDADQLPPVGPGCPFLDIIEGAIAPVLRLKEVFRQEAKSDIITAAHQVLQGEVPNWNEGDTSDFYIVHKENPADVALTIEKLVCERIPKRFGFDPIRDIQVLAPMKKGDCGTDRLNAMLKERLNPASIGKAGFHVNDRVIQTRNNYEKEVFNGDIGVIVAVSPDGEVSVSFDGRVVHFEADEGTDLMLAHAITVHKAQGSEFKAVIISLHTQHYMMLRRNLFYTALTRGKNLVVVVGNRKALHLAVSNDRVEPRNTTLAERLRVRKSR